MTSSIFIICSVLLLHTWLIYPLLVFIAARSRKVLPETTKKPEFKVTVLISALNEEQAIANRIRNVYQCDYPSELIETIVISDGSTDGTAEQVLSIAAKYPGTVLLENTQRSGRAAAHNLGAAHANGEILIFTDAATVFSIDLIRKLITPFLDPAVGFSSGSLEYRNSNQTDITKSAGLYWRFEKSLRQWETRLGLNLFGSGACCAMRRSLFRTIPATGDVDFTSPLDVALKGFRCVHVDDAIATDEYPETPEDELRARVRMTAKNFHGTLSRWGWLGIRKFPLLTIVLLSHKYGRWLTPFFLIGIALSSLLLLAQTGNAFWWLVTFFQLCFYGLGLAGSHKNCNFSIATSIYSFLLSNFGFLKGVLKVLTGKVQSSYTPMNQR